jgi:hypothetical protein
MSRHRKPLLFGLSTAAIALGVAATAFACVQTVGQLNVRNNDPSIGGTSTAIGNGHHPGPGNVEYCRAPQPGATAKEAPTFRSPRQSVDVSLTPSSECSPFDSGAIQPGHDNTPGDGSYEVMFCPGKVFKTSSGSLVNVDSTAHGSCFFTDGVGDIAVQMGFMTVTGGSGSGTFKLPGGTTRNKPGQYSGVSVREAAGTTPHPGPPYVNMAPIQITAL